MSFFSNIISSIFMKQSKRIAAENTVLKAGEAVWIALMRDDLPRDNLFYTIQEYFKQKLFEVRHTGALWVLEVGLLCFWSQFAFWYLVMRFWYPF